MEHVGLISRWTGSTPATATNYYILVPQSLDQARRLVIAVLSRDAYRKAETVGIWDDFKNGIGGGIPLAEAANRYSVAIPSIQD